MGTRERVQTTLLLAVIVGLPAVIVTQLATSWADWVIYAVLVLTAFAGLSAMSERQYTTKRRTFVRDYKKEQGPC